MRKHLHIGMKNLYKINFSISHQGCWTSKIRDSVVTLNVSKYNNKKVRVTIASVKLIVTDLKRSENVYEVLKYRKVKGGYVIDFLEDLSTTIAGYILSSNNVLEYRNIVREGIEKWEVITLTKSLIGKLSERFPIDNLVVKEIKFSDMFYNGLTEKEILVLKTAIAMGYFNYPRQIKAKEIAEKLSISKQDFLYHLRKSIEKIISSLIIE
ncbi:Bacterio-opsin activator HTH domain protein [Sulfolobus islandicus M.14.25]|uniref:Bacterio-opsin activator HTH domain protein n=4 Tax=Saccharolobus islandicus TaxID=43080 RepID=C4KGU0_SACI6|nr:Bacterio-opsin activator HTH domain protein [Sulfolobus islandicus M.14.25]ACP55159.1 Bacterio-opsin activator HTH domain protein [Sulfolobus islandicus M.16.27]ACR41804.1 Bacterio-opsin activator HTH domain protein [Sulfolobus islandicus M.16.4]